VVQVRSIYRQCGFLVDRTERLANALGKMCATVASLNEHLQSGKVGDGKYPVRTCCLETCAVSDLDSSSRAVQHAGGHQVATDQQAT
jgi:hypothetical protein